MQAIAFFVRFLAVGFVLFATAPALAGGVVVDRDSIQIEGGVNGTFKPGQEIVIRGRASVYQYASDEFGYMVVAIAPRFGSRSPTLAAVRRATPLAIYLGRDDDDGRPFTFEIRFRAPSTGGSYALIYSISPVFSRERLTASSATQMLKPTGQAFEPPPAQHLLFKEALSDGLLRDMATFAVSAAPDVAAAPTPPVYLRVDGKVPSQADIVGGIRTNPLALSWHIGSEYRRVGGRFLYRFKLSPGDDSWSAWTPQTGVNYTFLQKGFHEFRVQAKHEIGSETIESKEARLAFSLRQPLVGTVTKGPSTDLGSDLKMVDMKSLYPRSRALLVGLWEFDDRRNFQTFDHARIEADIGAMEQALSANGFRDIQKLVQPRLTREAIQTAIGQLVSRATPGDRLVIYFSTHGFADPDRLQDGYLATTDCELHDAPTNCLALSALNIQADRAIGSRQVQQVLFAVDSCFAGLGIVSKSTTPEAADLSRLAGQRGAFMITAGMADQKAEISPELGKSTFTHYLAQGLRGDADIIGSGVITLSELLVYVQYQVAKATSSRQVPMMGRISGGGEMLFAPGEQTGIR